VFVYINNEYILLILVRKVIHLSFIIAAERMDVVDEGVRLV
jgi:hypothetical protein